MTPQHIAILDDEVDITQLLATYLGANGFRVSQCHIGPALMDLMAVDAPDLVLLDLGLPGEDGFAIARRLRERWNCGLVIVTGRGDAVDRIVGLEIGADDYVPKPFEPRELLARLQTVLRRTRVPTDAAKRLRFDGLQIDLERREVLCSGQTVALTSTEFDLLVLLASEPQKAFSRDEILNRLRGHEAELHTRAVDILISRLRKKLEPLDCIKTLRNAGYTFAGARA